jgi:Transposase, Mutator family
MRLRALTLTHKTVLTDTTGPVELDVPRDRAATFEPQIVKRQRRLSGVDEVVLSLYAKGLTTGEISAHFAEIYGASVSKETISRITDKVIEEMNDWAVRPLDETYAAIFIDAIVVKVRDGQVGNRPFYAATGVTLGGERDILGLWAGTGGEGAKFWMRPPEGGRSRPSQCDGWLSDPRAYLHLLPRRGAGGIRRQGNRTSHPSPPRVSSPRRLPTHPTLGRYRFGLFRRVRNVQLHVTSLPHDAARISCAARRGLARRQRDLASAGRIPTWI